MMTDQKNNVRLSALLADRADLERQVYALRDKVARIAAVAADLVEIVEHPSTCAFITGDDRCSCGLDEIIVAYEKAVGQ